ncbi:MAG: hypothetical protein OXU23_14485 [Candidatus Poribacteria bacterium]|nr:hypothetical protein [Candidatus Poribacteria bacterium]
MFTDNRAIVSEMQERLKRENYTGEFSISEGKIHGSLHLNGKESFLKLYAGFFSRDLKEIKGNVDFSLHQDEDFNTKKVSLLGVFIRSECEDSSTINFRYAIIGGDKHITQDEKIITEVRFLLDDSAFFKNDFASNKTFGRARIYPLTEQDKVNFEEMVNRSFKENYPERPQRKINFGKYLDVVYFSGANEIVSIETEWGTVSVCHDVSYNLSMSQGKFNSVGIENHPFISLKFKEGLVFEDAMDRYRKLKTFIEFVIGRPTNTISLRIGTKEGKYSQVYDVLQEYDYSKEMSAPNPMEMPVHPVISPQEFSHVLKRWSETDEKRGEARDLFARIFRDNHGLEEIPKRFGSVFEHLPEELKGDRDEGFIELREKTRKEWEEFEPKSSNSKKDRSSILSALARTEPLTLRSIVHHRAEVIMDQIGDKLPELKMVTDRAIDCRIFYEHGPSSRKINFDKDLGVVWFLGDTLKFVFLASEFIDCGWDITKYSGSRSGHTHPMSLFLFSYEHLLNDLKTFLKQF